MAKTIKVENQEKPVQETIPTQVEVQEVQIKEENTVEEIKEDTFQEVEQSTPIVNGERVSKIIQKRPSHYSLLMEDGRSIVVHKSLFDKEKMIVKG